MSAPVCDLDLLLRTMRPLRQPGVFVYTSVPHGAAVDFSQALASIREPQGLSLVVSEDIAIRDGLPVLLRCAWITLGVDSDLQAIGFTAAFARALADAGVACNVVAGACQDHVFVPLDQAERAMAALRALQVAAAARGPA